jgi:hypothetical protein
LYYIGCPVSVNTTSCQPPSFTCGPGNFLNGESGISVVYSHDLKARHSPHLRPQVFKGVNDVSWDADVTNLSPWPTEKGTVLVYRGCSYNCSGTEQTNIATAPRSSGSSTRIQQDPIFPNNTEDPSMWQDKARELAYVAAFLRAGRWIW